MMNYNESKKVVMTLDAGGTNFVFSAMQGGRQVVEPFGISAVTDNIDGCLDVLYRGFCHVRELCPDVPVAISFAFPGPADYAHGVIGDLPNFPSFRGGVPLGPWLEDKFKMPVFINNDGALFAYGEAMAGALPTLNEKLREKGCSKQYHNLVGITLGTGFGGGAVVDGRLIVGDTSNGGTIWCFRNKLHPTLIAEESVSIRAVRRVYKELSGDNRELEPKDISDIAKGKAEGDRQAALSSFAELGEAAGDAIATACCVIDGIVVIGGGVARSADLIFPSLVKEMNSELVMNGGRKVHHIPMQAFNLEDEAEAARFFAAGSSSVTVPGSGRKVPYDKDKRIAVMASRLGTSNAIALGAYAFALENL